MSENKRVMSRESRVASCLNSRDLTDRRSGCKSQDNKRKAERVVTREQPLRQCVASRLLFSTRNSRPATRNSSRKGILLLVVLSLLTLFLMIGTAFIVTANQYRKMNKTRARITEQSQSPVRQQKLLDEVIHQLVRDTNNQNSVLRFHSLLRDLYGNDGFTGQLSDASTLSPLNGCTFDTDGAGMVLNVTNGQILELNLDSTIGITDNFGTNGLLTDLKQIDNAYNGLLVTFLDGPARGQSTRIVGYNGTNNTFRVMSFPLANGNTITAPNLLNGSKIVVNGRPFNGTGVGFNLAATTGARLTASESVPDSSGTPVDRSIALTPNAAFFDPNPDPSIFAVNPSYYGLPGAATVPASRRFYTGLGGSDESYDAVDFQNMAMALLPLNPIEFVATGSPSLGNVVLPSFHRPALINFWVNQLALATEPNMLRKVMMRPSWWDHPNFTGSNPDLASNIATFKNALSTGGDTATPSVLLLDQMIFGPWDVDNDNDGIRDSVWIDFGAPVMKGPNGKMMKPMAALLVLDMDGRLNLNAHGNKQVGNSATLNNFGEPIAGTGNTTDLLPQGQGYGTTEISLEGLMPGADQSERWGWYKRLFVGANVGETLIPTASDFTPAAIPGEFQRRRNGKMGSTTEPGRGGFDVAAQMKMQGVPRWATGRVLDALGSPALGGYASTPDLFGRYTVGLNNFGQPVNEAMVDFSIDNTRRLDEESPYEVDLSLGAPRGESSTAADGPFSVAELERILRAYDTDAGELPSRIWELAGEFKQNSSDTTPNLARLNQWRTLLTTDSYDMPVPSVTVPEWMVKDGVDPGTPGDEYLLVMGKPPVGATFADLLEYRIRVGLGILNPTTFAALPANDPSKIQLRREMSKLLSPDLADGLRMDINRAIGNGRDDNPAGTPGHGVVDEPGENEGAFWGTTASQLSGFTGANGRFSDDPVLLEDRNNDGIVDSKDLAEIGVIGTVDMQDERVAVHNLRRQMMARHLYVLAMTLVDPLPTAATTDDRQARARRLAQWAINIVDFRDPDNIMTAFEYDVDPFDEWGSAADPIDGFPNAAAYATASQAQLVWGSERPELLITETLAWHDLQIEDLTNEIPEDENPEPGNPKTGDISGGDDADQMAKPRGAFFLELYNPWPSNPGANADTHAKNGAGEDTGVNLSAFNIDPNDPTLKSPVWRVMIYKNILAGQDPDAPDTASQPAITDRDRCVYLTDFDPGFSYASWDLDGDAFHQAFPTPLSVRPGRYMVIGSGKETTAGSNIFEASILDPRQSPSQQASNPLNSRRIVLDATTGENHRVRMVDESDITMVDDADPTFKRHAPSETEMTPFANQAYPGDTSTCVTDVAIINMPRRLTLSEPSEGYPDFYPNAANPQLQWYPSTSPGMSPALLAMYPDGFYGTSITTPKPIDLPLDSTAQRDAAGLWSRLDEVSFNTTNPEPIANFRRIYLQRLANPLLPWNKDTNPYMTIDSTSANLTVMSGRQGAVINQAAGKGFYSNERGWQNDSMNPGVDTAANATKAANPWTFEGAFDPSSIPGAPVNARDPSVLASVPASRPLPQQINSNFSAFPFSQIPECTLGFLNRPFFQGNPTSPLQPDQPFPWLNWNNRPYINPTELMQVPTVRSSQLLSAFSMESSSGPGEVYSGTTNTYPSDPSLETDGRFGHLANFFRYEKATGNRSIVGLFRVLDYIHVPSRFVGTETWLNPNDFGDTTTTPVTSPDDPRYQRQPPFNRISSYREPGRMNLNTMANENVYFGLMHGDPSVGGTGVHPGPAWNALVDSRRGYGTTQPMLQLNSGKPTFFDNPFRAADAGALVPIASMQRADLDCTAMRSSTGSTGATAVPSGSPLFSTDLFGASNAFRDTNRNPYFRYQPMTRLSNLVTSRSNVYAVWVTIGFFEVEESDDWASDENGVNARFNGDKTLYDRVYPDGYQLGKEVGIETGEIERIREFAMIDRTVPVGFEPGNNHNVDKAIRVRRRIE